MKGPFMQKLPTSGPARESLREKGQFWTPSWLARAMVAWVTAGHPGRLFDPAVGPGTFFAAAREVGFRGGFAGFEKDDSVIAESYKMGLSAIELAEVTIGDFTGSKVRSVFPAIVANPPYIRHHRLDEDRKKDLRALAIRILGFALDGRVGLHVYFLLKCLEHLAPNGRLAFLLPADVCEGVSSSAMWRRLGDKYRIEAVLTFAESAAPFPKVDTNALLVLMSNNPPVSHLRWLRVLQPDSAAILESVQAKREATPNNGLVTAHRRDLDEALATGLSRPPRTRRSSDVPLSVFARVVRGIATGANEFFFLTSAQIQHLGLDTCYFKRAIGRTRDCPGDTLTEHGLDELDQTGRPTWLLCLGKEPKERMPATLNDYLQQGERLGLPERPLIKTRKPWYRMEQRATPAILFAYLGRRDCRFVLNRAGVVPLTGFLCVYPWDNDPRTAERLWRALNHKDTLANLVFVAKSYGSGALKVEPRQLDALEIPSHVLETVGLVPPRSWSQPALLEEPKQHHTSLGVRLQKQKKVSAGSADQAKKRDRP